MLVDRLSYVLYGMLWWWVVLCRLLLCVMDELDMMGGYNECVVCD